MFSAKTGCSRQKFTIFLYGNDSPGDLVNVGPCFKSLYLAIRKKKSVSGFVKNQMFQCRDEEPAYILECGNQGGAGWNIFSERATAGQTTIRIWRARILNENKIWSCFETNPLPNQTKALYVRTSNFEAEKVIWSGRQPQTGKSLER